jgi:hypothetical protein
MPRKISDKLKARNNVTPVGGRRTAAVAGPRIIRDDRPMVRDQDGSLIPLEDVDLSNSSFRCGGNNTIA